jgi:hypothetical protein
MSKRVAREDSAGGKNENFATPPWCVDRLLDAMIGNEIRLPLDGGRWLEPSAGTGSIMVTANAVYQTIRWTACEIRKSCERHLAAFGGKELVLDELVMGDFFQASRKWGSGPTPDGKWPFDVAIMNPPFTKCHAFVQRARELAPIVICLTRVNWFASDKRQPWFQTNMPAQIHVLPNRPSFTRNGRTDGTEYCWAIWTPGPRRHALTSVLGATTKAVRKSYFRRAAA